jgi:hypothetical protein
MSIAHEICIPRQAPVKILTLAVLCANTRFQVRITAKNKGRRDPGETPVYKCDFRICPMCHDSLNEASLHEQHMRKYFEDREKAKVAMPAVAKVCCSVGGIACVCVCARACVHVCVCVCGGGGVTKEGIVHFQRADVVTLSLSLCSPFSLQLCVQLEEIITEVNDLLPYYIQLAEALLDLEKLGDYKEALGLRDIILKQCQEIGKCVTVSI